MMRSWIMEYKLYLLLLMGIVFSLWWISMFPQKLPIKRWQSVVMTFINMAVAFVSVKMLAILEGVWFGVYGSQRLFGSVFIMPLLYILEINLLKVKAADLFDIFSVCGIYTLLCARINCCILGCCGGIPISGMNGLRWPTREAEMVFYIILGVWLAWKVLKGQTKGTAYPIYMFSYGVFRFLIEFLREEPQVLGPFHASHLWAALSAVVGAITFHYVKKIGTEEEYERICGKKTA